MAARSLIHLAKSKLGQHLRPEHRVMLFRHLADLSIATDPADSLDLCISLVRRAWVGAQGALPLHWLAAEAEYRLLQYLWSSPRFYSRLRRPKFDVEHRAMLLSQARQALQSASAAFERTSLERNNLAIVQGLSLVVGALESGSPADLALCKERASRHDAAPGRRVSTNCLIGYAAIVLGLPRLGADFLDQVSEADLERSHWSDRLEYMYLRSVIAESLGDTLLALALYREYALAVSARMEKMELGMRDALRTLSELPGARPEDLPSSVPSYLRRAIEMLRADPVHVEVSALALAVGVSEKTLRSAFRVHCGRPPKSFILDVRLDAAKCVLDACAEQAPTIAELAEKFGFSHPGRFAAAYRKRHGRRPGEDRR